MSSPFDGAVVVLMRIRVMWLGSVAFRGVLRRESTRTVLAHAFVGWVGGRKGRRRKGRGRREA